MSGYGHEVTLNGVSYRTVQERYGRRYLDVIRQQGGTQDEPSEFSLNPNDLWRRAQTDWVFGEGQLWFDDEDGVRKQYRVGIGVDPFSVKGEISLGPGHDVLDTITGGVDYEKIVIADGYLWIMQTSGTATTLERWDGASMTTTVAAAQNIYDIASDGTNVYLAVRDSGKTTGGVYVISSGSTTPVLLNNVIPDRVGYVMGRLMVAAGPDLYNITDVGSTTAPAALTASAINSSFEWDCFGYIDNFILAGGHGGDLSLIYRITIREDGTALTAPVVAAQLPDGEEVRALHPYLGVVVIGTTRGVRVGRLNGPSIEYGPLIEETDDPVTGLEPQGNYVYYGVAGGCHRLDLSRFIPDLPLTPAHASYLELVGTDVVTDVVFYDNKIHVVQGPDLSAVDTTEFSSEDGQFYSGRINYQMADQKHFYYIDVVSREDHPSDSIRVRYQVDGGTQKTAGTVDNAGPVQTFLIDETGEWIEFLFEFTKGAATSSPVLERWTLRSMPLPKRTRQIAVPLDLRAKASDGYQAPDLRDVYSEIEALEALVESGEAVTYTEFDRSYTVSLENVQWGPDLDVDEVKSTWEGICLVTLRVYE